MSIPPDFRDYEHDPVLSDERLTPDDTDEPEAWGRAQTRRQQAQDLGHRAQNTDVEGFGGGKLTQAQMGIGIETALTREEVMGPRPSGLPSAASPAEGNPLLRTGMHPGGGGYSDLVRQGAPLSTKPP